MKISVIIPCYNVERYVEQCICSVLSQTLLPYEIICVNDGSTDSTLMVLQGLQEKSPRLIKIIDVKNAGASAARNTGLAAANGELVQFLDADDIIVPEKFERQLAGFSGGAGVVISDWVLKDAQLFSELRSYCFDDYEEHPLETAVKKVISTCNPLYRMDVVKALNGYDASLKSAQDWDFHIRMVLGCYKVKYVQGLFFIARKVEGSVSSNWIKVSIQACDIIIKLQERLLSSALMTSETKKYIARLFLDSAVYAKDKAGREKYKKELLRWSEGNSLFLTNKFKRGFVNLFGIGMLIQFQRLKNRLPGN